MLKHNRFWMMAALGASLLLLTTACGGDTGQDLAEDIIDDIFDDEDKRAFADMSPSLGTTDAVPVKGRLVLETVNEDPLDTTPLAQLSQDELKNTAVDLTLIQEDTGERTDLGPLTSGPEGYFDALIDTAALGLTPGQYTLEVQHNGRVAGTTRARLLATDDTQIVIRSDVDLTYLDTDFQSSSGILELMIQKSDDRVALAAMETVYQNLRGDDDRPLTFLSGSPRFFKRILEGKMALDGVQHDGLVLKPFKDIVVNNITEFEPQEIVEDLEEQIGYKLDALLRLRLELPPNTREILMGDDSEADHVIYAIYHRFTSGQLDTPGLLGELRGLGVVPFWLDRIEAVAPQVEALVADTAPVVAIYINETGRSHSPFPVEDFDLDGLSRYHTGAWPLALDLFEEGILGEDDLRDIATRLQILGQNNQARAAAANTAVERGYLQPDTAARFE